MSTQYLFGDSDLAAHRLEVLADVYADSTTAFLREAVTNNPRLAVDMGCGPGFTTRLLADTLKCEQAVGLDSSEHFVSLAQKTKTDRISFYFHDVTSVPFPVEPADVIFCRYLLTHLQQPQDIVSRWATQLRPKGLLLMEEVDNIHTDNETFALYLNIVDAMLEQQSAELYVGRVLDALEDTDILKRQASKVGHVPVVTRRAAAMFYLNIQTWKHQPFIQTNYPADLIEDLQRELNTLASRSGDEIEIEWGLRQIVFRRAG
jgi:trans-aconitate 2-methyltransferase